MMNMDKIEEYRDGGHGFSLWCEDSVWLPIYPAGSKIAVWTPMDELPHVPHPETKRSYQYFWDQQKEVMNEALAMDGDTFKYMLVVLCWMRGDGKTYLSCLAQMWRFFCWTRQNIVLCANSKDQTDFISYNVIRDIIANSPDLIEFIGEQQIKRKEIVLLDASGNTSSIIQSVSSFSGIMSGITSYSFTEIHEMKNPEFFQQIHGSLRNVPNAMGFIDSTVSSKEHILYQQYKAYIKGKDDLIFFSYRFSLRADYTDYWHPYNTQRQLNSFKTSFLPGTYDRYFKNLWSVAADKVFSPGMVEAINFLGSRSGLVGSRVLNENELHYDDARVLIERRIKAYDTAKYRVEGGKRGGFEALPGIEEELAEIERDLWPVDDVYTLKDGWGNATLAPVDALEKLGRLYKTDWSIMCGIDRGQPMKQSTIARTILIVIAKGLPNSLVDDSPSMVDVPNYMYFILGLYSISDHSIEGLKSAILEANDEYEGIDIIGAESWGIWDMAPWCEEHGITLELSSPTYPKQTAAFTELYTVVSTGRLKSPVIHVPGSKGGDILQEEMLMFDQDTDKKWYGSPEKKLSKGVQDDAVYSLAWGVWGGRHLTVDDFRPRTGRQFFGDFSAGEMVGRY